MFMMDQEEDANMPIDNNQQSNVMDQTPSMPITINGLVGGCVSSQSSASSSASSTMASIGSSVLASTSIASHSSDTKIMSSTGSNAIIQLKLYNKPVDFWKRRYKDTIFRFKVSSIDMEKRSNYNFESVTMNDDSSNINDHITDSNLIKISILKDGVCDFKDQEQFGHLFNPDEFVILSTGSFVDAEQMAFMVDFYVDGFNKPIPEHIGFSYILPSNLRGSSGSCTAPITGKKHLPIGQFAVEYLMIKRLTGIDPSYLNHPKSWRPDKKLDVGHRGAGAARRAEKVENVLENTVASFNYASMHGADMVELDVQLTKDLVPVIYHDYFVNIAMKKRRSREQDHEFLQIPIKDLSLNQLHQLKLSPVLKPNKQEYDFLEDDAIDNQPFPTLQTILDQVDHSCGFNVEIKYPMQRFDGSWDATMDRLCDINEYVDIILKAILEHAQERNIVISCFHPDICALVAKKQTKYPILMLTQGITKKWPAYFDLRTRNVEMATFFSISMGLSGINAHAEDLIKDRSLINFVKSTNLILWTWGDDLNDKTLIQQLKQDGVDGVVYDKVDEYSSKDPKSSAQVFIPNHDPREVIRDLISKTSDGDNGQRLLMSDFSWQSSTSISPSQI